MTLLWLIRRTLARMIVLLSALTGVLVLFQVAIVAIAASLVEEHGFERIAGLVPTFLQHTFGMALASFAGMTVIGYFEPVIILLVVEFAVYVATEPAGDVEAGLVDLLLARPLPRHLLVTRSLLVLTGVAVMLPVTMGVALWASLWAFAPPAERWPDTHMVILLTAHLAAIAWAFGAAALAAAAWARRRGSAQALIGVAAVTLYLMEMIGESWSKAIWASRISPFHHFHGAGILAGQTNPLLDLSILIALGVAGCVLAYWQFDRRDL